MQSTLSEPVLAVGTALHSGRRARLLILPAAPGSGIHFRRLDVSGEAAFLEARHDAVDPTPLCTRMVNSHGVDISTIEHVMAALRGCGIDNAEIHADGPEAPILDGSSRPYVEAFGRAGLRRQSAGRREIEIVEAVEARMGDAWMRIEPAASFGIEAEIDFPDAAIGVQSHIFRDEPGEFEETIASARTFCRVSDVAAMQAAGRALGGSLENALVVDGSEVLSPGGMRMKNEPVRHKVLDVIGDLALRGARLKGRVLTSRPGHALTNALLREMDRRPSAWRMSA